MNKVRWTLRVRLAALLLCLVPAVPAYARIPENPAVVNIRKELLGSAKVIFRGRVLFVAADPDAPSHYLATFLPDRWYRGTPVETPVLSFAYNDGMFIQGHDCLMFRANAYWILFANAQSNGHFTLVHDCHGALPVSARLGPTIAGNDALAQMEADFEAGVSDSDPSARLVSIQRLGNLGLPGARAVLHWALEGSTDAEKPWIVIAALRTGDVTVLPIANDILASWKFEAGHVEGLVALQLEQMSDTAAVPGLLHILNSARDSFVKGCVLSALSDKIRDARALPDIAAYLDNKDSYLNWQALVGVWNITQATACRPHGSANDQARAAAESCKSWWESEGKNRDWAALDHAPAR